MYHVRFGHGIDIGHVIDMNAVDNATGAFDDNLLVLCRLHNSNEGLRIGSRPKHDISWIFSAARSKDADGTRLVGKVVDGVNELIANRDFKAIDRALDSVPAENRSKHVLITLARTTYPVRTKLGRWQSYVSKVRSEFERRGLDYPRLLRGLI